jgi:multiple sugar transport system ATP-binding protein
MRASLAQLHQKLGVTTVYVTHDQTEAMTLGHRVAVMRDGRLLQVDRPQQLYEHPRDVFIAAFTGSPGMNLVDATVEDGTVRFGEFALPVEGAHPQGRVVLGIRPESFQDAAFAPGAPTITARVEVLEELGADAHVLFTVDAPPRATDVLETTDETALLVPDRALFSARVDPRTRARVGSDVRLAVNTSRLHFFDHATGERLEPAAELVGAR